MRKLLPMVALGWALATAASAQVALPVTSTQVFSGGAAQATVTVDLGTMPARPLFYAEVTPDANHPDLVAQIEFSDYPQPPFFCNTSIDWPPGTVTVSNPVPGTNRLEERFLDCSPDVTRFAGESLTVTVRVLDYGVKGPPAQLELLVRGETLVPYNSEFVEFTPVTVTQQLVIPAAKDTTIYQRSISANGGAGSSLWAGTDGWQFLGTLYNAPLRSLLAFDVSGPIPPTANILNARLELWVDQILSGLGPDDVDVYEVLYDGAAPDVSWAEGDADPVGNEVAGAVSSGPAATWSSRELGMFTWAFPGGDVAGPPLVTRTITMTGPQTFDGPALRSVVADMVATGRDAAGFQLRGPTFGLGFDRGVRFKSRETADPPVLIIDFTPSDPYQSFEDGFALETGAFNFINEGQNFRWIYDTDQDDVLTTEVGGVFTTLPDFDEEQDFLPYHYQFTGTPGYTGLDCGTWQIDSPQTGTLGTGQAVFFHNLDPSDPANAPDDSDADGIIDLCDNCPLLPNGPLRGTCVGGANAGLVCHADYECPGATCSLSQEDADLDEAGDACAVPEPAAGLSLAVGGFALSGLRRRRGRNGMRR